MPAALTVEAALARASACIARRDAELLLLHSVRAEGRDRAWLRAHPEAVLGMASAEAFFALVERRARHEPVQYLTGRQEFFGLDLEVSRDTLIPRPETEGLVEAVLGWAATQTPALRIADVGTGTGAIALALAAHLPEARVWALDLSPHVRAVVERNAQRQGMEGRVRFAVSDLLAAVLGRSGPEGMARGSLDVVVSNPPYVPEGDCASLAPEVRDFEPPLALFAGSDGLAVYRRLLPEAWEALRPGGLLGLEFGFGQREALQTLLAGWKGVEFREDLAGIPRVALAVRP